MDPELEEHYKGLLKQWVMDEVSIKERLDEIEEKMIKNFEDLKVSMDNHEKKIGIGRRGNYEKCFFKYM